MHAYGLRSVIPEAEKICLVVSPARTLVMQLTNE